jgi:hypothetical protein
VVVEAVVGFWSIFKINDKAHESHSWALY